MLCYLCVFRPLIMHLNGIEWCCVIYIIELINICYILHESHYEPTIPINQFSPSRRVKCSSLKKTANMKAERV